MAIIAFTEVSKTYGKVSEVPPALRNLSFQVKEGELALIVGPSGAGKSTLLKLVLAMERPDAGTIEVAGRDISRLRRASIPYLRRNVGAVFQDFKLLSDATAHENVALALQVLGMSRTEVGARANAALRSVDIDPRGKNPVSCLSGGEQQRVAVARALAGDPPILLADEPTGNLDPALTRDILALLQEVGRRGTTVLLATHDPVVVERAAASQILRLRAGELVDAIDRPVRVLDPPGRGAHGAHAEAVA